MREISAVLVCLLFGCGRTELVESMASKREAIQFAFRGINTTDNDLENEGSAEVADNVVFLGRNKVGPRRGFPTSSGPGLGALTRAVPFGGGVVVFPKSGSALGTLLNGTWTTQAPVLDWDNAGPVSAILPPDDSNPVRFASARQSLYFTTSRGVYKVDGAKSQPHTAGLPAPYFNPASSVAVAGAGNWLATGSSVAYRAVVGRYDANNVLILSPPSNPIILTNTGALGSPQLNVDFSGFRNGGPTPRWMFLYRTVSATSTAGLSDEMFLVAQMQALSTDLELFIVDSTTDAFLQTSAYPLYTNANTGIGIDHANTPPPLARDLALFNRRLFYANTTSRQRLAFSLLGVGAPNGLQVGDTVSIGGAVFTGAAGNSPEDQKFGVQTSGSAAQNIAVTAQNLAYVVSLAFGARLIAGGVTVPMSLTYTSGPYDPPGNLLLEEIGVGGAAVVFTSSRAGAWNPQIPAAGLTTVADVKPGRLYWSERDLPEAVPLSNYVDIGAVDQAIQRIVATQDALFIFKADGLYRLTGADPSYWSILPFDLSATLWAPESAVASKSAVFALLTKGPSIVTSAGVQSLGDPVRVDLRAAKAQFATAISTQGWGVVYASEGRYVLALPISAGDAGASQQYVYDLDELGWTRWLVANAVHGFVDPADDRLKLVVGSNLWLEGKTYTSLDFNDAGAAFQSTIKFQPLSDGAPLDTKDWRDVYFQFERAEFTSATIGMENEAAPLTQNFSQAGPTPYVWGAFAWGNQVWGAPTRNWILHSDVPKSLAQSGLLGLTLSVNEKNVDWRLQAVDVIYEPSSADITR